MARLLQANRANKRWSSIVRTWVALRSQRRRRERRNNGGAYAAVAPTILEGWWEYETTEEGRFDSVISFEYADPGAPVGSIEIYRNYNGNGYVLRDAVPSTDTVWRDPSVSDRGDTLLYMLRYVNGPVVGPWSVVVEINYGS